MCCVAALVDLAKAFGSADREISLERQRDIRLSERQRGRRRTVDDELGICFGGQTKKQQHNHSRDSNDDTKN